MVVTQGFEDIERCLLVGILGARLDDFAADVQARATHVADAGVCRHKRRNGILEYCADLLGVAMVSSSRITSSTAWAAAMHTGCRRKC